MLAGCQVPPPSPFYLPLLLPPLMLPLLFLLPSPFLLFLLPLPLPMPLPLPLLLPLPQSPLPLFCRHPRRPVVKSPPPHRFIFRCCCPR